MKALVLLFVAAAVLVHTGCERHSAAQTVKGYAEKMAAKEAKEKKAESTKETVSDNPPRFFPTATPQQ